MDESRQVTAPAEPKPTREADAAPPQPSLPAQAAAGEPPPSAAAAAPVEPPADVPSGEFQADVPRVPEPETGYVTPEAVLDAPEADAPEAPPAEEAALQAGETERASSEAGRQEHLWARVPPPLAPPRHVEDMPPAWGEGNPVAAVAQGVPHLPGESDVLREAVWEVEQASSAASPTEAEPPEAEQTPAPAEVAADPAVPLAGEADAEAVTATPEAPAQPDSEAARPPDEVAKVDDAAAAEPSLSVPDIAVDESRGPAVAEPADIEALPEEPTPPAAPETEVREPEQSLAETESQPPDAPLPQPEPAWVPLPSAPAAAEVAVARAVSGAQPIEAAPLPSFRPLERASGGARTWPPSLPSNETVAGVLPYVRLAVRAAAALALGYVAVVLVLVVVYRWMDPPMSALMLGQRLTGTPIERRWVPLESISPHLIRAVILSEDGGFCRHRGVDWKALEEAIERDRGGSTITMQVVKNLFLWPSRSYVRKAIEICLAYLVELVWPKRRILEIYLNIAEWGDGVFGAEAAARRHFLKSAARLTPAEAALLAVSLPNPMERTPGNPSSGTSRLAHRLLVRMTASQASLTCVRAPRLRSAQAHLFPARH